MASSSDEQFIPPESVMATKSLKAHGLIFAFFLCRNSATTSKTMPAIVAPTPAAKKMTNSSTSQRLRGGLALMYMTCNEFDDR